MLRGNFRLKNEKDLNEEQIKKLAQVKKVSPTLKLMHDLKEKIRTIFDETDDWLAGLFELGLWLSKVKKHFPISQKNIIRWIDEILASASITVQLAVYLR